MSKTITAVQAPVVEPYLIGLPFGLSAWEVSVTVGRVTLLCGWQFRDSDNQPLFWVGANGKPTELSKDAAIRHAYDWEMSKLLGEDYQPQDCWEESTPEPDGEPDFEEDDMDEWLYRMEHDAAEWNAMRGIW